MSKTKAPDREGWVGEYEIEQADPSTQADNDDEARAQVMKLEKDGPPAKLVDWPTGKAMFLTFGGAEGDSGYADGEAHQLGPSSLRHFPDGSVQIRGEVVDNPKDYRRDQSVTDEAAEIGMDKGGGSDDEGSPSEGGEETPDGSAGSGPDGEISERGESERMAGHAT